MSINDLTGEILNAAFKVHTVMGPGLLESIYEECLCHVLEEKGIRFERQKNIPIQFENKILLSPLKLDLLVEDRVIVELKAVKELSSLYDAQLHSYMKLSGINVGLLINFNVMSLKNGIRRRVLGLKE